MNSNNPILNPDESKYKGVRKRKWGKWVSEIRLPHSRDRIWLGSYDSPIKAARAFDAAQFCLRGANASFNFPDNPPDFAGAASFSPAEIQAAASRFANADAGDDKDRSRLPPASTSSDIGSATDLFFDGGAGSIYSAYNNNNNYYYDLMTIGSDSGSGYEYEAEFGLVSGLGDFCGSQQPESLDYGYGYDNWNGSGSQGSFLWNF